MTFNSQPRKSLRSGSLAADATSMTTELQYCDTIEARYRIDMTPAEVTVRRAEIFAWQKSIGMGWTKKGLDGWERETYNRNYNWFDRSPGKKKVTT